MVENHCRDPSNEGSLWCYTTDNKLEREMCKFKGSVGSIEMKFWCIFFLYTIICENNCARKIESLLPMWRGCYSINRL